MTSPKNLRQRSSMNKIQLSDLVVVTSSKDKLTEINQILGTNHKVSTLDIPEIQSLDLDEILIHKAKEAYYKIKKSVLVEDISFEIHALNDLPGPFIKFFLKTLGTEGTVKLLGKAKTDTTVTAGIAIYDGNSLKIFKGTVYGTLSSKNRGKYGFGFDKIFIPKGSAKTLGEMLPSLKNKISHRAIALKKVKQYLSGS